MNTTWSRALISAAKPKMPEPAIPVAASMNIQREQHLDALPLIQDVTEMARGGKTATG